MVGGTQQGSLREDIVLNVGSQMLVRLVTAVSSLYVARVVGPAQFGLWAVLQVLFMYTAQAHLGTANAMMRHVPMKLANGDEGGARIVANNAWGFLSAASLPVAVVSAVLVWWMYPQANRNTIALVVGTLWLVMVQLQSVFLQFYTRAYGSFRLLAACSVAQSATLLPLCLWLVPRWGLAGYLFALSAGFSVTALAVATRPTLKMKFQSLEWRALVTAGLPMLPGTLMLYLNMSIERVVLVSRVNATAAGLFAAGAFFFQIGGTIWELFIYTWYARLTKMYARSGRMEDVAEAFRQIIPGAIWASSLAQGALFIVLPSVLNRLLPEYQKSVAIAQVLVLGVNVWGLAQLLSISLTAVERQKQALALQGTFLIVKLAALATVAAIFMDSLVVAFANVACLVFYVLIALLWWKRCLRKEIVPLWMGAGLWLFPTVAAFVCCSGPAQLNRTMLRLASYCALVGVASVLLQKRTGVLRPLATWSEAR